MKFAAYKTDSFSVTIIVSSRSRYLARRGAKYNLAHHHFLVLEQIYLQVMSLFRFSYQFTVTF